MPSNRDVYKQCKLYKDHNFEPGLLDRESGNKENAANLNLTSRLPGIELLNGDRQA